VKFSKKLAALADIFVNDAFATAHRAHASTCGVSKFLPSYSGLLMENEISNLNNFISKNKSPFTLIIGGAKIDTKIGVIKNFIDKADNFVFGGGIANTFLKEQGYNIGKSLVENDKLPLAKKLSGDLKRKNKKIYLLDDVRVAKKITNSIKDSHITTIGKIKNDEMIFDIGPKTIKQIEDVIAKSKTIIWNGPFGVFEYKPYQNGTLKIIKAISKMSKKGCQTLIGGGDSLDALKIAKISNKSFTHVSTGGGAMLEYMEGKKLPGVQILLK
jgi:phosphoglycerate kinase